MTIFLYSIILAASADEVSMTVKDMLPFITNKEASQIWIDESSRNGSIDKIDPNNPNIHKEFKDSIPPIWTCVDGEDLIEFSCWEGNPEDCTPQWHKVLQLDCPIKCKPHRSSNN